MVIRTMIFYSDEQPSVVVIKGMFGIGKTTLAREIYNHPNVVKRFEYRAWVCVSNVLTMKEIVIKLLDRLSSVNGKSMQSSSYFERVNNQLLQGFLGDHLEELRYFIVLDDLPKHIQLRSFLLALKAQGYGKSKLVVTSHMTHKDLKTNSHDVHKMEPWDPIMS
ncbi:putative disease resistance RPP13-like protein 2 [Salvia hispanica]|uniref:putative disease resistance RPP13-like protein 2 n=1 Tax=Salvia hispanica TaxID=49212 RepID=UPI0020094B9E|nr:putative disease resistance RPP13-like protein 2 [Salvia hispanica]